MSAGRIGRVDVDVLLGEVATEEFLSCMADSEIDLQSHIRALQRPLLTGDILRSRRSAPELRHAACAQDQAVQIQVRATPPDGGDIGLMFTANQGKIRIARCLDSTVQS